MKKIKAFLFILFLMIFAVAAFGCSDQTIVNSEGEEVVVVYANIEEVAVNEASALETDGLLYDTFKWTDISVHITYTDGDSIDIPLTEDMITAASKILVSRPGTYTINAFYGRYDFEFVLKLYTVTENLYAVSFYDEDGTSAIGSVQYFKDGGLAIAPGMPTKEGLTHIGWREKDSTVLVRDFTIHKDTIFVAVYEANTYEVHYYYTAGEKSVLLKTIVIERGGNALDYAPAIPVLAGFSNGRWANESAMKSVGEGNTDFYIIYDPDRAAVTFSYYKYVDGVYFDYNISWNVNAETEGISPPDDVERSSEYVFLYWYVERDGKELEVTFPYVVTGEIKFKAKYVSYAEGSPNIEYAFDTDRKIYTIENYVSDGDDRIVVIPNDILEPTEHKKYPVAEVKPGAFSNASIGQFAVSMDNTHFRVYNGALYTSSLSELIAYPTGNERTTFQSVSATRKISSKAFYNASKLIQITLSNSVSEIGSMAFAGCTSLTTMTIPGEVTIFEEGLFEGCASLMSVEMGSGVKQIKDRVFYGAISLQTISLPASLETIGEDVFAYCNELSMIGIVSGTSGSRPIFRIYNGALYGYNESKTNEYYYLYAYPAKYSGGTNVSEYSLNPGVREIKRGAFVQTALVGLNVPAMNNESTEITFDSYSVVSSSIISLRFDTGTIIIDDNAFGEEIPNVFYTTETTNISMNLAIPIERYSGLALYRDFVDGFAYAFIEGDSIEIIAYRGKQQNLEIPGKIGSFVVTSIKDRVFIGNTSIRSVTIPNSVKTIGEEAFYGCANLTRVNLGEGVMTVGNRAFDACGKNVTFSGGEKVEIYGQDAYGDYDTSNVSGGVIAIGSVVLSYKGYVKDVVIPSSAIVIAEGAFENSRFISSVDFSAASKLKLIQARAFYGCEEIEEIIFPESLVSIEDYAFSECLRLNFNGIENIPDSVSITAFEHTGIRTDKCFEIEDGTLIRYNGNSSFVVLPDEVKVIGQEAFANNTSIQTVLFNNRVTTIEKRAFSFCTSLREVILGSAVMSIGEEAFAQCILLKKFDYSLAKEIETIEYNAFDETAWLKEHIDDSVIINDIFYRYIGSMQELHVLNSVTLINERAFYGDTALEVVHLPESIIRIGKESFAHSHISVIDFSIQSDRITEIEESAFEGCENFSYLDIRNLTKLQVIGPNAFKGVLSSDNSLLNIYIPASVIEIGEGAFENSGIKSVKFASGSKLEVIEKNVFANNAELESVFFEGKSNLYDIKECAFEKCLKLKVFNCSDGKIESIAARAFAGDVSLSIFTINDDNLLYVGEDAFLNNKFIENNNDTMVFVGTVLIRYKGALSGTVVIPKETTAIGNSAFKGNSFIKNISFVLENGKSNVVEIQDNAFADCDGLVSLTIPDGVKTIGDKAFAGCTSLTSIAFGADVETIGEKAFAGCDKITSVELPTSLKSFGGGVFAGCISLTSVSIANNGSFYSDNGILYSYKSEKPTPNSVPIRTASLLAYPSGLEAEGQDYSIQEKITVAGSGYNVVAIGDYAFSDCKENAISFINVHKGITRIGKGAFSGINSGINFAADSLITYLSEYAYAGYKGTDITIPESITEIGDHAFEDIENITSINIPQSVVKIGSYVFAGSSMTILWGIAPSLTEVGDYAFCGYEGNEIALPESVTTIGRFAFYGITSELILSDALTTIGEDAFNGYKGISKIVIPDSVTLIGERAFKDVTNTNGSIDIPASVTYIGRYAFENVTADVVLNAGAAITEIGNYVFAGYLGERISIPENVTEIGWYAFYNCINLKEIHFAANCKVETIGRYAFYHNDFEEFDVPDSVTMIGERAFFWCENLTTFRFSETSLLDTAGYALLEKCSLLATLAVPFIGETKTKNNYLGYLFGTRTYLNNQQVVPTSLVTLTVLGGSMNANALYYCSSLKTITIAQTVDVFEKSMVGCSSLREITVPYGGVFGKLFGAGHYSGNQDAVPATLETVMVVGVTQISDYAFYFCNSIIHITIPEDTTYIGTSAFLNCSRLDSIKIGASVETIGANAFARCSSLSKITVDRGNTKYVDSDGVLYSYSDNLEAELIVYPQEKKGTTYTVELKRGEKEYRVVKICDYAFYYSKITEIDIPESVASIGTYAFYGSMLTYVRLRTSGIGNNAFRGCKDLKTMYIENGRLASISMDTIRLFDNVTTIYVLYDTDNDGIVKSITEDTYIGNNYELSVNESVVSESNNGYVVIGNFGNSYAVYSKKSIGLIGFSISKGEVVGDVFSDDNYGTIYVNGNEYVGGNKYPNGATITLSATASEGYIFIGWFANGKVLSLNDTYGYTITNEKQSLTAEFLHIGGTGSDTRWSVEEEEKGTLASGAEYYIIRTADSVFASNVILLLSGEGVLNAFELQWNSQELKSEITGVKIGNGFTQVGESCFIDYEALKDIGIAESVVTIGKNAFKGIATLTSINISDGVRIIEEGAFSGCSNLSTVSLGSAVERIGDNAFMGIAISSILLPSSLEIMGQGVFIGCRSLQNIKVATGNNYFRSLDGVLYSYDENIHTGAIVAFPKGRIGSYTIVSSFDVHSEDYIVTGIMGQAFYNCNELTEIILPDSITEIGDNAFAGCSGLQFSEYVNALYLGNEAHPYIVLVKALNTDIASCTLHSETKFIHSLAFENCIHMTDIQIGGAVMGIGSGAFSSCVGLHRTLYNNAYYLGDENNPYLVLYKAEDLDITSCTVHGQTRFIYDEAFKDCTALTSVGIENSVINIGKDAFRSCGQLTSLSMGTGVKHIGENAFFGCVGLENVYMEDIALWCGITFENEKSNPLFYAQKLYLAHQLITELTIPDTVKTIKNYAFYNAAYITSVVIPDSVTIIGDSAFRNGVALANMTVSNKVKRISDDSFLGCAIETARIPVKAIAYMPKDVVRTVIVTSGSVVGYRAFEGFSVLQTVTISDLVTVIEAQAFYGCTSLTTVIIGSGIIYIGANAFGDSQVECSDLNAVYYTGDIASWCGIKFANEYANPLYFAHDFYIDNQRVIDLEIGDEVTEIKDYAFIGAIFIENISISDSVERIGDYAFDGCTGLHFNQAENDSGCYLGNENNSYMILIKTSSKTIMDLTLQQSTRFIYNSACEGCDQLRIVTINENVIEIGSEAFKGCATLSRIIFQGTISKWNTMEKGTDWDNGPLEYTVSCMDGSILITR